MVKLSTYTQYSSWFINKRLSMGKFCKALYFLQYPTAALIDHDYGHSIFNFSVLLYARDMNESDIT